MVAEKKKRINRLRLEIRLLFAVFPCEKSGAIDERVGFISRRFNEKKKKKIVEVIENAPNCRVVKIRPLKTRCVGIVLCKYLLIDDGEDSCGYTSDVDRRRDGRLVV